MKKNLFQLSIMLGVFLALFVVGPLVADAIMSVIWGLLGPTVTLILCIAVMPVAILAYFKNK